MMAVTVEQAATLCGAVVDWRPHCFGGLNPQTHNFSELEEERNGQRWKHDNITNMGNKAGVEDKSRINK